jgi:hypothetical protein
VGIEIARGAQLALDDVAVEIGDDQVGGGQGGVIDAAGLDDDKRPPASAGGIRTGNIRAMNAAGVAEGVGREAAAGDFPVGEEDLFAEGFEQHGVSVNRVNRPPRPMVRNARKHT